MPKPAQVERYLSRPEFAEMIGVKPDTLNRYQLPPHDAEIGSLKGWRPETVKAWNDARPGRGRVRRPAPPKP